MTAKQNATEGPDISCQGGEAHGGGPRGGGHEDPVYAYKSAGIAEREGRVPAWLWVVVVSLLLWGAYYLVSYWYDPSAR